MNFGTDITESALKILIAMNQLGNEISEDCLTLNVWTKLQTGAKKPVMVWIYGGGMSPTIGEVGLNECRFCYRKQRQPALRW